MNFELQAPQHPLSSKSMLFKATKGQQKDAKTSYRGHV
jgi:hypothetical protein